MKFKPSPPIPRHRHDTWPRWHITQGVYLDFYKFKDPKSAEKFRDIRLKHKLASWELGMQMIEFCMNNMEESEHDLLPGNTNQSSTEET